MVYRREDLRDAIIGHWYVQESLDSGFWGCTCVCCGAWRKVRLNRTQTNCPPCLECERGRSTIEQMLMDRERHFARAKHLRPGS